MEIGEADGRMIDRMLDVMEHDIVPLTRASVEAGNKVFGAAILAKETLDTVVAATNRETENPLWHGEMSCLNDYWALPAGGRPAPADCLFLSTHEPCCLCLSAITWSGFDNFYYFFSYEDSRDAFEIPHDLRILEAVFDCPGGQYVANNAFWRSHSLHALIHAGTPAARPRRAQREQRLRDTYAALSTRYQAHKGDAGIPLA